MGCKDCDNKNKNLGRILLIILFFPVILSACGGVKENDLPNLKGLGAENIFLEYELGDRTLQFPEGWQAGKMETEDGTSRILAGIGDLCLLAEASEMSMGKISLEDMDKETFETYIGWLLEDETNVLLPPAYQDIVLLGKVPCIRFVFTGGEEGGVLTYHTVIDGMSYTLSGWFPGEDLTQEQAEIIAGITASLGYEGERE